MRIRSETRAQKYKRLQEWHTIFAWKPRRVSETEVVWLEKIERRYTPHTETPYWWEYRTVAQKMIEAAGAKL